MPALHRLTTAADTRFASLISLYQQSFPPEERKPTDQLRTMLQRPDYHLFTAGAGEDVTALSILFCSRTAPVALLEYLAVQPSARGQGIGRALFRQLIQLPVLANRPLLIEAESDRDPAPEQAERRRRKQFYRSLDAREIAGLRYRMPAVATATPPPMELLLYTDPPPTTVPKATLAAWLTTLYTEVYGQTARDPRLATMMAELPETIATV